MPLKIETKTIHVVDYSELERLANEVYAPGRQFTTREYNFAEVQECSNDSDHAFTVSIEIKSYDQQAAQLIRAGTEVPSWRNGTLLNCLCLDGHIEPGNYLVTVRW